MLYFLSWYYK